MAKRRKGKRKKGHGPGGSRQARKERLGKMSLGCLVLLVIVAAWLVLPRVLSGGGS